jgi:uncharacterized protein (TIGR03437 family)
VGLKSAISSIGFLFLFHSILPAAPMLRLSSATIGPILLPSAGATNTQILDAFNAGDGALNLSFSTNAPWLSARLGEPRPCRTILSSVGQNCSTIQVTIATAGLPAGLNTATLTVSDPNAVDAPQTVTVVIRIGTVAVDVGPGSSREVQFKTSGIVTSSATPANDWLSVVGLAFGSFRFDYPSAIRFNPPASMAEGNYNGSVTTSGSAAADNQTLPVAMRVTNQPAAMIAEGPEFLNFRLAQGALPVTLGIPIENAGRGTLTIQSVTATGSGISATAQGALALVTFDPGSLDVGTYRGTVTVASNAVNQLTVPVTFEVAAKGAPLIAFGGVVDNGTYDPKDPVSPGDIVLVKGEQLANGALTGVAPTPLPTTMSGARILVNGRAVPIYYTSYGQLAFQMPTDIALGTALVRVERDGQLSNTVSVVVVERAPRLLKIPINKKDYGAIHNFTDNYSIPMPAGIIPGVSTRPAKAGDVLILYAIGLGTTNPVVPAGTAAPNPPATVTVTPEVILGSGFVPITVTPFFAGISPGSAGLYQVNFIVPPETPKGDVEVRITVGDSASNTVLIVVQ